METNNKKNDQNIIPNDADKQQKGVNVPNLRFKEFNGDWIKSRLSNYLVVSSLRNKNNTFTRNDVISVSGDLGCVNQIQLLGRSFAGVSLIPYHIVEFGDIVYTKSPLSEYPYGIIKTNRYQTGIVSTLYAVYKTNKNANNRFIEHYFGLKSRINNYLKPIVKIGAKHDMKVGNEEVLSNFVCFPDVIEQVKIANFIDLLDQRIDTQNKIIEKYESLIKAINQMMCNFDHEKIQVQNVFDFKEKTKHQANMGNSQGNFIYFTNEESTYKYFDSYDFDGEYIIANTGGKANFKYYNGKFAVMSDCLVMKCNDNQNTKFYLYSILNRIDYINQVCFVGSGLKHLDKKLFLKTFITKFNKNLEPFINLIILLEKKNSNDKILLQKLKEQKKYLLSNMFI